MQPFFVGIYCKETVIAALCGLIAPIGTTSYHDTITALFAAIPAGSAATVTPLIVMRQMILVWEKHGTTFWPPAQL